MESKSFNWDAADFFRRLAETNKLARSKNFKFCLVSSLEGFEEALARMQSSTAFVCVSDVSSGSTDLTNSPHTVRTKTVFFAVRHKIDDMKARMEAFDLQREIFRQFMSKLILESTRLAENRIFIDQKIRFSEIDKYFFSGCACSFFNISVSTYTDLRLNADEWE